jgi:hypothetical protein
MKKFLEDLQKDGDLQLLAEYVELREKGLRKQTVERINTSGVEPCF